MCVPRESFFLTESWAIVTNVYEYYYALHLGIGGGKEARRRYTIQKNN